MANTFAEGFAQYADGQPFGDNGIWNIDETSGEPSPLQISSDANKKYLEYNGNNFEGGFSGYTKAIRSLTIPSTTNFVIGYAINYSGFSATGTNSRVGIVIEGTSSRIIVCAEPGTGKLEIWRGGSIQFLSSDQIFFSGVRAYIEVKIINGVDIEVRASGTVIASFTVTDIGNYSFIGYGCFKTGGSSQANSSFSATTFTDVYINTLSGAAPNNDYIGEISVFTLFPDSDELPSDWTVTGAASGFEALNNVPPNLSEYVESSIAGDVSAFGLDAIGVAYQIFNVRAVFYGDKSASGDCDVRFNIVKNSATGNGTSFSLQENTPQYFANDFPLNPDTGAEWNPEDFAPTLQVERTL